MRLSFIKHILLLEEWYLDTIKNVLPTNNITVS